MPAPNRRRRSPTRRHVVVQEREPRCIADLIDANEFSNLDNVNWARGIENCPNGSRSAWLQERCKMFLQPCNWTINFLNHSRDVVNGAFFQLEQMQTNGTIGRLGLKFEDLLDQCCSDMHIEGFAQFLRTWIDQVRRFEQRRLLSSEQVNSLFVSAAKKMYRMLDYYTHGEEAQRLRAVAGILRQAIAGRRGMEAFNRHFADRVANPDGRAHSSRGADMSSGSC